MRYYSCIAAMHGKGKTEGNADGADGTKEAFGVLVAADEICAQVGKYLLCLKLPLASNAKLSPRAYCHLSVCHT